MSCPVVIVNFDTAVKVKFIGRYGKYFKFHFIFKNADGTPRDISDRTFSLKIYLSYPSKAEKLALEDSDFTRPETNEIKKQYPAFSALKAGVYLFDFSTTRTADGVVLPYAIGEIVINDIQK